MPNKTSRPKYFVAKGEHETHRWVVYRRHDNDANVSLMGRYRTRRSARAVAEGYNYLHDTNTEDQKETS